ncbi:hypothetical protein [Spirochaeta cellobiosiphila]|uniref:hypothetical protein n=1 Tax=Spirochaeta cellobiosiphila TaxID=504483 RepID=UPI000428E8CB|nr:hypothetical protein [Spirochaeta cellobiosiphila]
MKPFLLFAIGLIPLMSFAEPFDYNFEDLVYDVDSQEYKKVLNSYIDQTSKEDDKYYAYYLLGMGAVYRGDEDTGVAFYNKVINHTSLQSSYQGRGLIIMSRSQLLILGGFKAMLREGRDLAQDIENYWKEDPSNPMATLMFSHSIMNMPKFMGGDPDRAIKLLLANKAAFPQSKVWKFEVNLALSKGYDKIKEEDKSMEYLQKAKALYPHNPKLIRWEKDRK